MRRRALLGAFYAVHLQFDAQVMSLQTTVWTRSEPTIVSRRCSKQLPALHSVCGPSAHFVSTWRHSLRSRLLTYRVSIRRMRLDRAATRVLCRGHSALSRRPDSSLAVVGSRISCRPFLLLWRILASAQAGDP